MVVTGVAVMLGIGWYLWTKDRQKRITFQERPAVEQKITEGSRKMEKWKFGVMADIHNDTKNLEEALRLAKSEGVMFVILTGDLTVLGKRAELAEVKGILEASGVEYRAVPGNHDWWWSRKFKDNLWREFFGENYYIWRINGIKFLMIDNGDWQGIGEKQMAWLREEAGECRVVKCVAVAHMPLNHAFSEHIMGEESTPAAREASEILRIFRENNIKDLLAGHLHYSGSYEEGGVRTYLAGAITGERNTQTARFVLVEILGESIETRVVELEGER